MNIQLDAFENQGLFLRGRKSIIFKPLFLYEFIYSCISLKEKNFICTHFSVCDDPSLNSSENNILNLSIYGLNAINNMLHSLQKHKH